MSSTTDKISGKAKQAVGKMTDNKEMQAKGKAEEARGKVKSTVKDVSKKLTD